RCYGRVWYFRDITERKWVEKALHESDERLRQAVRAGSIGIFDHDHRSDTIYWSPEMRCFFGWDLEEPVNLQKYLQHVHADDRVRIAEAVQCAHDPKGDGYFDVEYRIVNRNGAIRWLSTRSSTHFEGEGSARHKVRSIGAVVDITERKQAEAALQASQERLKQIFEASPNVTSAFRIEGQNLQRTWVSPNLERLFGYTIEEALQPHWWSAHVQPEDLGRVITDAARILAREHIVHEYRFLRRDGNVVWIRDELRLLRDATGKPQEVVGAWTDITERKELETHLLRTQRLESVGRLASGIAHDLNNILAPMLMVPPLLREVVKDPELRNMLDLVETNAQRGSSIIKQLLTFGRGMEGERVPVQLRALVNEMSGIIRETFHKNITTWREMPPDIWLVSG